jgi:hypothetical protein
MKHETKWLVARDNIKKQKQVKITMTKVKKLPQNIGKMMQGIAKILPHNAKFT